MGITRYQLGNDDTEPVSAKLLYVTYSKYENDWSSLPHTHYFTELFYVKKGCGTFLVEDQRFPIKEDDFVIVNPNISHTETSMGDDPLEYIILGVEGLHFSFEGNREHILFNCRYDQSALLFYMNTMYREMEEKRKGYELVCQNLLEVLILQLIRRTNFAFEVAAPVKASHDCSRIKQYIETNYTSEITLDLLAKLSHLNKYYLVHAFTAHFGCSPIHYLTDVRIQASKELLTCTDYSISEVAASSGFSSQSYFAQCFQKHCHMSARQYRNAFRERA